MEHGQSRQCRRPTHGFRDQLLRNSEPSEPSYVRSGWLRLGLLSFVTSFYGNGGTKFPDKIQAVGKLAGSYEYTNTTGGNVLDGAISRAVLPQLEPFVDRQTYQNLMAGSCGMRSGRASIH